MNFPPIAALFFFCGALSLALGAYAWRHRGSAGTVPFALLMVSVAVYSGGYAMELGSPTVHVALLWSAVQYIGILGFPILYLFFVLHYIGKGASLTPARILLFCLPFAFFYVVKLFDQQLGWIYASAEMQMTNSMLLLSFKPGPLYTPIHIYQVATVTWANHLLLQKRRFSSTLFRRQSALMLWAALMVYIIFGIYLIGVPPIPILEGIDINPLAFALWSAAIGWAIFRYRFLDLTPIAREVLIETLRDGVVVLDAQRRVVDANTEALKIFGWKSTPMGQKVEQTMEGWISEEMLDEANVARRMEKSLLRGHAFSYYEVTVSVLREERDLPIGYLVMVHDTTDRKNAEKELEELSLSDELTGLSNRRGFNILASQVLGMANRMHLDAVLFYLDIDGLKSINDHLGHAAGDQALRDVADTLRGSFRATDVLARLGGDEFVVLALESNENSGDAMFNRLDANMKKHSLLDREFQLSFSVGQARYEWERPQALEVLLEEADQAMYTVKQAKKEG